MKLKLSVIAVLVCYTVTVTVTQEPKKQEQMPCFKAIPHQCTFPTRMLLLPILSSLQRNRTDFGQNSDIRNAIRIFQHIFDSFRYMIKVIFPVMSA